MSNEIVLYMYSVLVGFEIGRTICKSDDEIIITMLGICGYVYLIMFNNPGQAQLEAVMYTVCTLCSGIMATLCYIILWKENQTFNDLDKENDHEQGVRTPVQRGVSPQGIGEILQRQERIRTSIANPKGDALPGIGE